MSRAIKDSGIPWIGEIPQEWEICSIKQIMKNKSVRNYPDENVLSLYRDYGVVPKDSRNDNHNVTSEDTSSYKFVEKGDFVLNKMKAWQGSMAVSDYQGIISPAYYICQFVKLDTVKRFIHYLLRNEAYKTEYMRLSTGLRIGQWDLNINDFLGIKMIYPKPREQQVIADFLDVKCAEVDELIALQEKMIDELKVYKQSVITEAVTKGLNPDAPLKNSGIEWIGQIPKHWIICKLKNLFKTTSGATPKTDYTPFWDGDIIWVTPADYKTEDRTILTGRRNITMEGVNSCGTTIVPVGSIVFSKRAPIGLVAINKAPLCTNQGCISCIPNKKSFAQFYYFLISVLKEQFELLGSGTTFKEISASSFESFNLIAPPIEEQQQIADYLDTKCAEIDEMTNIKQQKIDQLKEYKKSIIYEYVTGKKQVNIE